MTVGIDDLKALLLAAGVRPGVVAELRPDQPLLRQGLDSVDYPIFAAAVEDHYGIRIADGDCQILRSLNDFAAYVTVRQG